MGMFSELKKIDEKAHYARQDKTPRRATPSHKATTPPPPPVNQPINRAVNPPVNHTINLPLDTSQVIAKPKGFYITRQQDEELDDAVKRLSKKLEGKAMIKIDRSVILRLILEEAHLSTDDAIERLSNLLINRLINQLTNKYVG
jgi:hypothetical protein